MVETFAAESRTAERVVNVSKRGRVVGLAGARVTAILLLSCPSEDFPGVKSSKCYVKSAMLSVKLCMQF